MPTSLTTPVNGQSTDAAHLVQLIAPLNNLEKGLTWWAGPTGGTSTAYTATATPTPSAGNVAGTPVLIQLHTACGSAPTFALNGMAALPMRRNGAALSSADLASGAVVKLVTDGTYWHVVGDGGGGASTPALDDLTDVDVTAAANGNVLMKTPSGWEDRNLAIADTNGLQTALDGKSATSHTHTLSDLSDAAITTPALGNVLRYDGTNFVNQNLATTDIQSGNFTNARLATGTASSGLVPVSNGAGSSAWGSPTIAWKGCVTTTPYLGIAATTLTTLAFDYEIIADAAIHSPTTNNSRFIADSAGKWELTFTAKFADASPDVDVRIYENGGSSYSYSTHGKAPATIDFSVILDMDAAEYCEIKVYASGVINLYSSPGPLAADNPNYARAIWRKVA